MTPADGIRKLGFRRWYERQLIECHAYFVTCFLCMLLVACMMEGFSLRGEGLRSLVILATLFGSVLVGVAAYTRYMKVLDRAERIAEHSTCSSCSTYGRLMILHAGGNHDSADESGWMRVQCRKCGHQWTIA